VRSGATDRVRVAVDAVVAVLIFVVFVVFVLFAVVPATAADADADALDEQVGSATKMYIVAGRTSCSHWAPHCPHRRVARFGAAWRR
jgi:hypothetical protein